MAFCSRFDGIVNDMSRCKITIPPILMVMFFLWSLHSRYDDILEKFRSRYKSLEDATLDSIVTDVCYHDEFIPIGKRGPLPKGPKAAAAAATSPTGSGATDKDGKSWNTPFEWLSRLGLDSVKKRWKRALAGYGFCPLSNLP